MTSEIYFNLNKKSWSIRQRGLVVNKHSLTLSLTLKDVSFRVNQAGRQRVLREKQKNVHAFAAGTLSEQVPLPDLEIVEVTYNPYKFDYFYYKNSEQRVVSLPWLFFKIKLVDGERRPFVFTYKDK